MKSPRIIACYLVACVAAAAATAVARAETLYDTGFDDFTEGADQLVGTEGWLSTLNGEGIHGIDDEKLAGLGKSAYLGFYRPSDNQTQAVSVWKPFNFDPIAEGKPLVEFEALIAIVASEDDPDTNLINESLRQDRFFISVYNSQNQLLAAIVYETRTNILGIYRNNGSSSDDTEFEFVVEEPQYLYFLIDFENNTWSASLDGAPLFTDATFNGTGRDRDLGLIAAEWVITNRFNPGDNWMLFDDWYVAAESRNPVVVTEPFEISKVARTEDNKTELTYPADVGCTYTVQYSTDLKNWLVLNDTPITPTTPDPKATYLASSPSVSGQIYYRIVRTEGN